MKDMRRCIICNSLCFLRKHSGMCQLCKIKVSKVRSNIAGSIYSSLKYDTNSYIWKYLPYSICELKEHLENKFEFWMNWSNRGKYISYVWDDNNPLSWTWQIDHIIPQSNFIFLSVSEQNFIDCWSLSNLRPISSKLNVCKNIKEGKYYEA